MFARRKRGRAIFAHLDWLWAFRSDAARLVAVGVVAVAFTVIGCIGPITRTWLADRRDAREHELRKAALVARLEQEIARRRRERLDLDG
jgi:hypothetical protein